MRAQAVGLTAPWQPGDVVGHHVLVARIAVGGMAEIWLARQIGVSGPGKIVAIKKISDSFSSEPEFVEMFLDEARIAAQLDHPNIVQIFDLGEHAGSYYIAMEYLHGEDLAQVVRGGLIAKRRLPLNFAVKIIAHAAAALSHAHNKLGIDGVPLNVIHRDVSPQNLIVTYDGQVKMVDFGIAKAANRSSVTVAGQLKGKMSYMSPEQARGDFIDPRSDLFTLGVVLWECLTCSRLFRFDDGFQALAAIAGDDPIPPPSQKNPEVPPDLDAITARALQRERQKRFQTADDFLAALEGWLTVADDRDPSPDQISAYMNEIFRERIAQRVKVLEAADEQETLPPPPVPMKFEKLNAPPAKPDRSPVVPPLPPPRRGTPQPGIERHTAPLGFERHRPPIMAAVIFGLVAGIGVAYQLWPRAPVAAVPTPAPPQPEVVAELANEVDVETDPPGATISIDGTTVGLSPLTVRKLTLGEHRLVASLKEYPSVSRAVRMDALNDHLKVVLAFPPRPSPAAEATPFPVAADQTDARNRPSKIHPIRGRLTLETIPWSEVFLGDRKLGDTPLIEASLPVGRHTLRLVNEDKGIRSQVQVEIHAGKTTIKKLQL